MRSRFCLTLSLALGLLTLVTAPSLATVYFLEADGSGDFPTIQAAFDAALPMDEIVLRPGTYTEFDIEASPEVSIRSESGPEVTVIDATGGQWGIFSSEFAAPLAVEGITIRGADITALLLEGGGVERIADCVVYDCGVGMYVRDMNGIIENCTITGGHLATGTSGSGLSLRSGNPVVRNCNVAFNAGYGIVEWFNGNPDLSCNNVFGNDDGNYRGVGDPTGTDDNVSEDPQFCGEISDNYSVTASSICAPKNSPCSQLIGALEVGCDPISGACCNDETGQCLYVFESICLLGGDAYTYYPGDFCDPNPCPQPAGACCLQDGTCELANESDCGLAEGNFRGYDEPCEPNPCTISGVDIEVGGPASLRLVSSNPSRGEVDLGIEIGNPVHANLEVFGPTGRRIAVLLDDELAAGAHEIRWSGRDDSGHLVGSGVFFVRLTLPETVLTQQIQILR